jgi:hypothetical protein
MIGDILVYGFGFLIITLVIITTVGMGRFEG